MSELAADSMSYRLSKTLINTYYEEGYWTHKDFWSHFDDVATQRGEYIALIDGDRKVTFAELRARAIQFAGALNNTDIRPNEVVIIHGRHAIEAVISILGCAYAGVIPALLPAMFSADQIVGIIEHTQSRLVIATGIEKEVARAAQAASVTNCGLVCADYEHDPAMKSWNAFNASQSDSSAVRHVLQADALALLIFSSGTTGAPKGVMHSANTIFYAVNAYAKMHGVSAEDIELVVTAFGFVGSSLLGFYLTLLKGCKSVLMRHWGADEALASIAAQHPTHFLLMPTHAIDILNSPLLAETDCTSVSRGVVAGVSKTYRNQARKQLCGIPFPMYGMSESPAHITGDMSDDWSMLEVTEGRPLPGAELRICDDNGEPVAMGDVGEILVRGPNRFLGYYKADALNDEAMSVDGFFKTGDMGFINEQGYVTFLSRKKDIIRRGGVTITPADIEEAIRKHPKVRDIAVIGLPDDRLGERACACVIPHEATAICLAELTEFLDNQGVARYLWPEDLRLCSEFPRTPSLKVQKNQLRQQVIDQLTG
jgi:acyl-CoA synthetase (AMP-forming)/AMP-acid ligase II